MGVDPVVDVDLGVDVDPVVDVDLGVGVSDWVWWMGEGAYEVTCKRVRTVYERRLVPTAWW